MEAHAEGKGNNERGERRSRNRGNEEEKEKGKQSRCLLTSKALADRRGGITGGVECVGDVAHLVRHSGHFCDSARVVADRPVGVNGQSGRERGQDSERGRRDSVHARQAVRHVDGHGKGEHGNDHGLVAQRQTVDDVGRSAGLARVGNLANGGVLTTNTTSAKKKKKKKKKKETDCGQL